jgi:hypothetical protein
MHSYSIDNAIIWLEINSQAGHQFSQTEKIGYMAVIDKK